MRAPSWGASMRRPTAQDARGARPVAPRIVIAAALAKAQALSSRRESHDGAALAAPGRACGADETCIAPSPRDFRYVKRRNPWRLDLSFSVSPVSNINNGSRKGQGTYELPFFGVVEAELSGAALPLSGTEIQTGVALRYRLDDRGRKGTTDLHVIASRRDYRLSDEARETAPDVEGSDFAFSSAQVVLSHTGQIEGGDLSYQLGATLARTWYAGAPYSQSADLSGALHVPITPRRGIALQLGLRREEALSPLTADARGWRGAIGWRGEFGEPGHRLFFDLERAQSVSENAAQDWGKFGIDMRVKLARPVLGVALNFGLSAAEKRFDRSPVAGRDRTDRSMEAEIAATVPQLDFYGFMPRVSVSARRTESDFDQYDTQEIGLRLGFRSAF